MSLKSIRRPELQATRKHFWNTTWAGCAAAGMKYIMSFMFSLSETLRVNGMKAHDYLKYVLTEMSKYKGKNFTDSSFVDELLPSSDSLPPELWKTV